MFADDPHHPIPYVNAIDVHCIWRDGGSDLNIVIAQPLAIDAHSRERLMRKIETYLNFIGSAEYEQQCGKPTTERTKIVVNLHPDMDVRVEEALKLCVPWVESRNAKLVVQHLGPDLKPPLSPGKNAA